MVGAVLIHDREPLDPIGRRTALRDVDDAGIEIAGLAGDALIDRIGDLVRHPAPVVGGGGEAQPPHLRAGEHVPQAKLDDQVVAVLGGHDFAGHQRLGVDLAPVGEAREIAQLLGRLDEGAPVDRPEQTGALEIGADHVGDVATARRRLGGSAVEFADRDRQRLDHPLGDVELELRLGGPGATPSQQQHRQAQHKSRIGGFVRCISR